MHALKGTVKGYEILLCGSRCFKVHKAICHLNHFSDLVQ